MQIGFQLIEVAAVLPLDIPDPGLLPPSMEQVTDVMGWAKFIALGIGVIAVFVAATLLGSGRAVRQSGEHTTSIGPSNQSVASYPTIPEAHDQPKPAKGN